MIEDIDLERWLAERSSSVETRGSEIIYTHAPNEESVLVKREGWRDDLIPVLNPMLANFYTEYLGASIGGMLLFATSVEGGLSLSLGYKLRDFYDLKNTAATLDVLPGDNEDLFMMGYAGMFFYGYKNTGEKEPLRCHDRDYKSTKDKSFSEVIDNWWEIVTNG